jgi:hypothetical protein
MTISRTMSQLATPPPGRRHARLLDETGDVGWIDDRGFGFTGFATLSEVMNGAWVAHVALERRAAKSRGEPAPYIEATPRLSRKAEQEWIEVADKRVALLVRPAPEEQTERWFGFEILFPAGTPALDIDSGAHVVYRGLRRSGIDWTARRTPPMSSRAVEAAAPAAPADVTAAPLGVIHGASPEVQHAPAA